MITLKNFWNEKEEKDLKELFAQETNRNFPVTNNGFQRTQNQYNGSKDE